MVGTVGVAKLTRLAANCICPVVGAGVITATVPPVRHAVHHLTAPHEVALPKTRVRPVSVAPCAPAVAAPIAALSPAAPAFAYTPLADAGGVPNTPVAFFPGTPGVPGEIGYPPPGNGTSVTPPGTAPLPETRTWVQMIVGFGLVGVGARYAHTKLKANA